MWRSLIQFDQHLMQWQAVLSMSTPKVITRRYRLRVGNRSLARRTFIWPRSSRFYTPGAFGLLPKFIILQRAIQVSLLVERRWTVTVELTRQNPNITQRSSRGLRHRDV